MDGRSGLPLTALKNPGHLLRQTKLPGQDNKIEVHKVGWVKSAYEKTNSRAELRESWQSCIACGKARSTENVTRLKEHLLVCVPYLLSAKAAVVPDEQLKQRIAAAKAAPVSGMGQSTLTVSRSSVKRKLMRAFADELTKKEAGQLETLFAEMVIATNLPHSWTEHAAVQKFFKALRPAFKLPSRRQLSTPLLLGVYAAIASKVTRELQKHSWVTVTSDGWSRQQGSQHITNYQAVIPGASYFIDITTASTQQLTVESPSLRSLECLVAILSAMKHSVVSADHPQGLTLY